MPEIDKEKAGLVLKREVLWVEEYTQSNANEIFHYMKPSKKVPYNIRKEGLEHLSSSICPGDKFYPCWEDLDGNLHFVPKSSYLIKFADGEFITYSKFIMDNALKKLRVSLDDKDNAPIEN